MSRPRPRTSHRFMVGGFTVAVLLRATLATAQSGASFQGISALSGHTHSEANAVSGDGATVVGASFTAPANKQAIRWTLGGGPVSLGFVSGPSDRSHATGVSFDGGVIVGNVTDPERFAFRWSTVGGMQSVDFGGDGESDSASGVSDAGDVMAGTRLNSNGDIEAVRWTAGGALGLGGLLSGESYGWGISGNGAVVVGTAPESPWEAFRWSAGLGMLGLGIGPAGFGTWAHDASLDGSVIVGLVLVTDFSKEVEAMRWTASTGPVSLGDLSGGNRIGIAWAVSGDGSVIVGSGNGVDGQRAFIWTQAQGMRDLKTVLTSDLGLDLTGWTLDEARGISADGRVIVGAGTNPQGLSEGWVAVLSGPDTDGDGLLDDWETNGGIPYTDSFGAQQRYELDFDGVPGQDCHVDRKDLFIEVDCMVGFAPNPAAYIPVRAAFTSAPVSNPNGAAPGIKLHIIEDELDIPAGAWTKDDTNGNGTADWPTEFDALKLTAVRTPPTLIHGYFGTISERNFDNTVADATAVRGARAKVFRYCIFGRSLDATVTPPTTGPSGIAELAGNDLMVTLGLWDNGSGGGGGTLKDQAGTFMHELGHTLGLRHGGNQFDPTNDRRYNYKPNYYSVMNYAYQTPKAWMPPGTWPLDPNRSGFSSFALPTLDETALNECVAQVVPGSALAGTMFISSYVDSNGLVNEWFGVFHMANDWNNNNTPPDCESAVAVDINRLMIVAGKPAPPASPGDMLTGHDDWAALLYDFRIQASFAPGVHNSEAGESSVIDITFEENQALVTMLPPFCAGDIVSDRSVNIDDLLAVISAWGACPQGCLEDIAPLPADGVVNIDDLLTVIGGWGACR